MLWYRTGTPNDRWNKSSVLGYEQGSESTLHYMHRQYATFAQWTRRWSTAMSRIGRWVAMQANWPRSCWYLEDNSSEQKLASKEMVAHIQWRQQKEMFVWVLSLSIAMSIPQSARLSLAHSRLGHGLTRALYWRISVFLGPARLNLWTVDAWPRFSTP